MTGREPKAGAGRRYALLTSTLMVAAALSTGGAAHETSAYAPAADRSAARPSISKAFGKLPLSFVENRGQVDARAAYYVQGRETSVFFSAQGIRFVFDDAPGRTAPFHAARRTSAVLRTGSGLPRAARRYTLGLDFVGANRGIEPVGQALTSASFNFFRGPRSQWKTDLRAYSRLLYRDLWPGIDLIFSGTANRMKYAFLVKPGADPDRIRLAYRGARAVRVNGLGQLEVLTPRGRRLHDAKPHAYQEVGGKRLDVAAAYALLRPAARDRHAYGFHLGRFDPRRPLVLDPAILVYAGYFGRAGDDRGLGIAVNGLGNTYFTGQFDTRGGTGVDAYVVKVNAEGTNFVYSNLIGGTEFDAGFDVAVNGDGNAYVTGGTRSTEATFPVVGGPDVTFNGRVDAWVAKVSADGSQLLYSGYIGGRLIDFGEGIGLDEFRNTYVSGPTESRQESFPVKNGPDPTHNGRFDIFVTKVKPDPTDPVVNTNLEYSGYIGGVGNDAGVFASGELRGLAFTSGHIAVRGGEVYVSGMTDSTERTFPSGDGFGSISGADRTHNGGYDAYVVKLDATANFVYATYIGGSEEDLGFGMAVDGAGNAYLTGRTASTETTFPVAVGPDLTFNGEIDAFVAKVNVEGTALLYAGYIGGAQEDQGLGVAVDPSGSLYVVGHTHSPRMTFPAVAGPDLTINSGGPTGDAFVGKLKAVPSDPEPRNNFDYLGYIGGGREDSAFWVALDGSGNAYVVGDTESPEASFPDGDGFGSLTSPGPTYGGGACGTRACADAFVAKVGFVPESVCSGAFDLCIDTDGFASPGDGLFAAADVTVGTRLTSFPITGAGPLSGLGWFDEDGNGAWSRGFRGDDLHAEDPAQCPGAVRNGQHDPTDCVVLDFNGSLAALPPVSCDLEFQIAYTAPCPTNVRYHDLNGDGVWETGEDLVLDANDNGVFD